MAGCEMGLHARYGQPRRHIQAKGRYVDDRRSVSPYESGHPVHHRVAGFYVAKTPGRVAEGSGVPNNRRA